MAQAVQRIAARRDFVVHYAYLAENAGLDTAKRFRAGVEKTYSELAAMPRMGAPGKIRHGRHAEILFWRVRDFEQYLIAYRARRGGVAIERLVHAKQDYQRVLK